MAEGPEMAGELALVPRIGIATLLGRWIVGTDCGWPCNSAELVEMGAMASWLN